MDHIIKLPKDFQYVNQFLPSRWAPNPSKYRCVTATMAMLGEIAYPDRWVPPQLEDQLYTRFAGPDVPSDKQGLSKEEVMQWFDEVHIGYVNMARLIGGDQEELLHEIEAQNQQNVPQLITVADESKLYNAKTGAKLHNWIDVGLSHSFLRVGYSDSEGYGLYFEPAAPGFPQPVPIAWHGENSIVSAGIITAIAVMPGGVKVPPAGFSFQHGTWPAPKPVVDIEKVLANLNAIASVGQQLTTLAGDLAKDVAALKSEV